MVVVGEDGGGWGRAKQEEARQKNSKKNKNKYYYKPLYIYTLKSTICLYYKLIKKIYINQYAEF